MSDPNAYGVRLWLTCPACGNDTPMWSEDDAPVCAHCGDELALEPGWLAEELSMFATTIIPGLPPGVPRSVTGTHARVEVVVEAPACPSCHAVLPPVEVEALDGRIDCPSCGAAIRARSASDELREHADITAILGEEGGAPAPAATDTPLILRCMWCANRLVADGSARTITCEHCATPNIIPSTIWHRLHPEPLPPRWYLLRR